MHSPFLCFPFAGQLLNFVRCKNLERVVKETIQFRVVRPGKNRLTVLAMCDSYAGCDVACEVEFRGEITSGEELVRICRGRFPVITNDGGHVYFF